jgi:uncharacterized protein YeaO (DUF488 family)
MGLRLQTYAWGEKRRPDEGLRLSCTRFLPRGVTKESYARDGYLDVWLPTLAPSAKLVTHIRTKQDQPVAWKRFVTAYKKEMSATDPRQVIRTLAALAETAPISIGCSCTGARCHRFELERLIRAAADGKF